MNITKLRNKYGSKLDNNEMANLICKLEFAIHKAGFVTQVVQSSGTSVKVANRGNSFVIDTNKLGYNARINTFSISKCKTGYKRCNTPTWAQREQFNHIINNVLDQMKFTANIKSGEYVVRDMFGRKDSWDMPEPVHGPYGLRVPSVLEIVRLPQAAQAVEWHGVNAPWIAVGK